MLHTLFDHVGCNGGCAYTIVVCMHKGVQTLSN